MEAKKIENNNNKQTKTMCHQEQKDRKKEATEAEVRVAWDHESRTLGSF